MNIEGARPCQFAGRAQVVWRGCYAQTLSRFTAAFGLTGVSEAATIGGETVHLFLARSDMSTMEGTFCIEWSVRALRWVSGCSF
jgi:hypothetical protein